MTEQEIFEIVKAKSKYRCMAYNGSCVYSDRKGNHCAVGWVLQELGFDTDSLDDKMNIQGFTELMEYLEDENLEIYEQLERHGYYLMDLQDYHDSAPIGEPIDWERFHYHGE